MFGIIAAHAVPEDGGANTSRDGGHARRRSTSVVHPPRRCPVRPAVALCVVIIAAVACSAGRDARAVVATTFGHLPAPAGSALVQEDFTPRHDYSTGFGTSRECGVLRRLFATNDADAFLRAVLAAAQSAGWQLPNVPSTAGFGVGPALRLRGEQTVVSLVFYDFDDRAHDPLSYNLGVGASDGPLVDRNAWRFLVRLWIRDASDSGWSDCVDQTRVNP